VGEGREKNMVICKKKKEKGRWVMHLDRERILRRTKGSKYGEGGEIKFVSQVSCETSKIKGND